MFRDLVLPSGIRAIIFCAGAILSVSCAHRTVEPNAVWTDEALFEYYVSVVTKPSGGTLSDYKAFSGNDMNLILSAVDFVENLGKPQCEKVMLSNQYFFVDREGDALKILIEPSFTPDPENISGVFPNPDGKTQTIRSVRIEGARPAPGCFAVLRSSDGGRTFTLVGEQGLTAR